MFPSLVQLSVNKTATLAQLPPELWRNVLASVIDDDMRVCEGADPDWRQDIIRSYAESLDRRFSQLCKINHMFRDLCVAEPSIWWVIVQKEREVMIDKLNELQAQQETLTRPGYRFEPIDDFLQLFLHQTGSNLNAISHTLGRLEAMRILVLLFGAPRWYREFMWVVEDEEGEEEHREEEFHENFAYMDDDELGPEGGGSPPED